MGVALAVLEARDVTLLAPLEFVMMNVPLLRSVLIAWSLIAIGAWGMSCDQPEESSPSTAESQSPTRTRQGSLAPPQEASAPSSDSDNRPPVLEDVSFAPSTFVNCGETTRICIKASDPDGDTLATEWRAQPEWQVPPNVVETSRGEGTLEQCVDARPALGGSEVHVRIIEHDRPESRREQDTLTFPLRMPDTCE